MTAGGQGPGQGAVADVPGTGGWAPDAGGARGRGTWLDVRYRLRAAPAARLIVQVGSCDLEGGGFGVCVSPLFAVWRSPAAAAGGDASDATCWFEDTEPLPGAWQEPAGADQAAAGLAASLADGDPAALTALGSDLAGILFGWDGGLPEMRGPGPC